MLKLNFFKDDHQAVDLGRARITVGRDANNDIVLGADGISGFHAEIQTEDGRSFLVDLGSTNGTFVNGREVTGRQPIEAWDKVRFDSVEAEVVDPERRRPTMVSRAVTDKDLAGNKATVRAAVGNWALKGVAGAAAGKTIPIAGSQTIGRDAGCEIVIADDMVSSRHATIESTPGGVSIRDLGSTNGTFVNGKKIDAATLKAGDEVRLDQVAFTLEGVGAANKTAVRPAVGAGGTRMRPSVKGAGTQVMGALNPFLSGMEGSTAGKKFSLKGSRATVGRTPENDIAIDDDTVSSAHAVLTLSDGTWRVEDAGSTNGTFVNGGKITNHALKPGDTVQFGQVKLRFEDPAKKSAGTKLMPAVDADTKTSVKRTAKKKKNIPAWAYGVGAFVVVGVVLFILLFKGNAPKQSEAKLQASKLWSQQINGRKSPTTPVLADINGDKFLDVVVADASGYILAMDGAEGKKVFEAEATDRILAPPVSADLSGDGIADVVVASNSGVVMAINGKGQTLWKSDPSLNLGEILNRPVLADVDGDGTKDVIVPTANKGLVALSGKHGWQIWNTAGMTRGKIFGAPIKADLNHDGTTDFLSVTDQGQVLAVTGDKGRVWQIWEATVPAMFYASPLYLNQGKQGLVILATEGAGIVALHADTGRMAWTADIKENFFASPVLADANGDKVPDVVVVSEKGDIHVLNSLTGDEIWEAALGSPVKATPALYDVNNDGLKDLIILDGDGNLRIVDMARGRQILGVNIPGAGGFIASPVLGDVNNDGMLDVVAAGQSGLVSVYTINRLISKGTAVWPCFLGGRR